MRKVLALAVCIVAVVPGHAPAQTITWNMANEYPATSIQGEADQHFARVLRERSGGRMAIAHHFDASLGFRSREMLGAIGRGAVPLGNTYMGALGDSDPVFLLPSLPFLAVTTEQAQIPFEVAQGAYEKVLARHNQRLLYPSPWPPAGLWAVKPLASLEALKGLHVRTADANGVLAFQALGAMPVQVSFSDAIPQLRSGALDAVLSSCDGGAGARLSEVLKHFTEINYAMTMSMVTLNLDAWNGLAPDLRVGVLEAAAATRERQWLEIQTRVAANYERMRAAGVTITTDLPPGYRETLQRAGQAAVDEWLKKMGPDGAAILEAYKRRLPVR